MMFEDKSIFIMTYSIETIIAEKFETIISRNALNTRAKDFYDIYTLVKLNNYNKENLVKAVNKTFSKRNTQQQILKKLKYNKRYFFKQNINRFMEQISENLYLCKRYKFQ